MWQVAVVLVLQAPARADLIDPWSLSENPIANGTAAADSAGPSNNLTYHPGAVTSGRGRWGAPNTAAISAGNAF